MINFGRKTRVLFSLFCIFVLDICSSRKGIVRIFIRCFKYFFLNRNIREVRLTAK